MRFPIPRASKRLKGVYLEIRLVLLARVSNNVFIMLLLPKEIGRVKFRALVVVLEIIILWYAKEGRRMGFG